MLPRIHKGQVKKKLSLLPAVTLLGPRQCGKTTLARSLGGTYFDLENEGDALRLDAEWKRHVSGKKLLVLDEAQNAPWVFRRLRGAVDAQRKRKERFLLLGSVSPHLMREISETLAGRMGLVRMSPFLLPEVGPRRLDDLWFYGGYPDGGILDPAMFPHWQEDYLEIMSTRDLPNWGLPAKPGTTRRLLRMLCALHGRQFNASQVGAALGLDHKTVFSYLDYLEGAFLVRRLAPFSANLRKRLVKRPRFYWRDSGLLHALMGVSSLEALYDQPWVGASWEGFVLEQTLSTLEALGRRPEPFFFRTAGGEELDLVLDWGGERWALEIKLTSSPSPEMAARLRKTADLIGASRRILVCRTSRKIESKDLLVTGLSGWLKSLRAS